MRKKHQDKKKNYETKIVYSLLILLLLTLGGFLVFAQQQSGPVIWDEAVYLANARDHIATSNFIEDFRFPLLEYLIATVWLVTGESILIAQLLMIIVTLASTFIVFVVSKRLLENQWLALLTTVLYATSSLILFWGFRVYNDILALTFVLLAVYFYLTRTKQKQDYLVGIMAGLAFLTRFPIIIFAIAIGLDIILKKKWKRLQHICTGGILVLIPWLVGNSIVYGNPFWDLLAQQEIITAYAPWQAASLFFLNISAVFGLSLLFLIPFIIYLITTKQKNTPWPLITGIISINILYYAFFTQMKFPRYLLIILPFMFIIIIKGMQVSITAAHQRIKQSVKKNKLQKKIIVIISILFVMILLLHASFSIQHTTKELAWISYCQQGGAIEQSIDYLTTTYPEGESIISNYWTIYGYYGNYDMMSLWSTNITAVLLKTNATILAYVDVRGLPYPEESISENDQFERIMQFKDECGEQVRIYKLLSH